MRNLKRALSLLLSSTMVLGMLVMGGSAAGYKDVDASNDHQEAIEVLQAVGVMSGVDNEGNFDPDGSVTRNQMAVIMAHLLNLDYDYYRGTNPFTDVPEWAAPYVAACAAEGVIAGIGNNQFGGEMKVTAAQASLMIMKALGYFQNAEDFGTDWQVATIRQASYINLFDKIDSNAESALTRGQVAQLVLNGLQSDMVYFTGDKGIQIGDVTVGYKAEYTQKTGTAAKYNTLVNGKTDISEQGQYYIQLGEELYNGQLRKAADADDFDRPSFTWSYKGEEIGTYVDWSLMVKEYTTDVTGQDLYNLLTSNTIKNYELTYYVDGAVDTGIVKNQLYRNNTSTVGSTGRGVLTQVFVDNDAEQITIVSVNTYLAQANADYNSKSETISLQVYDSANGVAKIVDLDDVPAIADLKEGDFVLVNWAGDTATKSVVAAFDVAETLTDVTVSKFSKWTDDTSTSQSDSDRVTAITTDGTEYKSNENAYYEDATLGDYNGELLTNKTYDIYMDQYGYFIGAALHSGQDQYVFIAAYDNHTSAMGIRNADALAIFTDGVKKEIEVNTKDTNTNIRAAGDRNYAEWNNTGAGLNLWYTYSETDGVYTLAPATRYTIETAPAGGKTIRTDNLALNVTAGTGRSFGNEDSTYITVEDNTQTQGFGWVIDEVTGVYTGVQSVTMEIAANDWIAAVYDKNNYIIAAIVLGEAEGAVDNYAYILSGANSEGKDADGNYYWTFDAVMNGEVQEMTIKSKYTNTVNALTTGVVQELVMDSEGYVTKIRPLADADNENGYVANVNDPTADQVYSDSDYMAGNTAVSNFDVYHMTSNGAPLYLVGRTLHFTAADDQYGLFFASDAKAVVRQTVNGKTTTVAYGSVKEAYSILSDSNNVTTDGLNFKGEVVAVLDANGVAKWVFFDDQHPITSGDRPNYTNGKIEVLGVTFANSTFNVNVGTKEAINNASLDIKVYSGNFIVAEINTSTTLPAGGTWTYGVPATITAASGNYRVVVTTTDANGVVRSGEANFAI